MKILNTIQYYYHIILLIILNIKSFSGFKKYYLLKLKNGTSFVVRNFMDIWTLTETYLNRDYEKHGINIGKKWTIIDIGAAFGDFSIFVAQKSPLNHIIAVEPLPSSVKLLRQNIANNHLNNIDIFSGGISSSHQKICLSENTKNYGHSFTSTISSTMVKAISLPKLFQKYKLNHCQLIKCDCEGSEYDIFLNLQASDYQKIDNIIMEYHLFTSDSKRKLSILKSTLKKYHYTIKISPNPVHSNLGFLYAKRIF